jgi:anti-sigma-K factor RskA
VREYQEAATALPLSLSPIAPSAGLKTRVMAAAGGQQAPRRPLLSRVFWAAAAVVLFGLVINSLSDTSVKLRWTGTEAAPKVAGTARWDDRIVKVAVAGLPALPAGKVYQLWHIGPVADPIPCRTFPLKSSGTLEGEDSMKHLIARGHKFALTVEPEGGSLKPTAPIFAITQ